MKENTKAKERIREEEVSQNEIQIPLTAKVGEEVYIVCLKVEVSPNETIQVGVDGIGNGVVEEIQYDSRDEKMAYMVIKKNETQYCHECKRNPCMLCVKTNPLYVEDSPFRIRGVLQELIFPSYEKALEAMQKIKEYDWNSATEENWFEIYKELIKPEYSSMLRLHLPKVFPNLYEKKFLGNFINFVQVCVNKENTSYVTYKGRLLSSCCEVK